MANEDRKIEVEIRPGERTAHIIDSVARALRRVGKVAEADGFMGLIKGTSDLSDAIRRAKVLEAARKFVLVIDIDSPGGTRKELPRKPKVKLLDRIIGTDKKKKE